MNPDEELVEFQRLLDGVRRERASLTRAQRSKAEAERQESNAKAELQRWDEELSKHVRKMSGAVV